MKFCSSCGTQLEDNAAFCSACGASAGGHPAQQPVVRQQPEPRWETHVEQTTSAKESDVIKIFEGFGWEVTNTQTVKTKDSHLENRFGSLYSVTESEEYVKITFRRNKNMRHYQEIKALDDEYRSYQEVYDMDVGIKPYRKILAVCLVVYGIIVFLYNPKNLIETWVVGIGAFIAGVIFLIKNKIDKNRLLEEYSNAVIEAEERASECQRKAEELLNDN